MDAEGPGPEALRRGDPAAVEAFVRSTIDRTHAMAVRLVGPDEAEDLVQEVYLRAFRGLPAYRGEAAPSTWLWRIAMNVVRDAWARRRREREAAAEAVEVEALAGAPDLDPALRAEERELDAAVAAALGDLEEEERAVIVLREAEGMDVSEAAAVLGVAEGTVKSRLHRAKAALRRAVGRRLGREIAA